MGSKNEKKKVNYINIYLLYIVTFKSERKSFKII